MVSSGLDANDADRNSSASEGAYQSQSARPDWIKLALDAPMVADPGERIVYGSANPLIVGGIESYKWFMDPTGIVYMGGGLYLRPRAMLKIGQLYLNGGTWNGRRILSQEWVDESRPSRR